MEKEMRIKGHCFGKGKPVVCVPVVEQTAENIIETIQSMVKQKVEMIEWRMDWYEEVGDISAVKRLLEKVRPYFAHTVFLCTFRSRRQGGERELTEQEYLNLNQTVAESGVADFVDLEFYEIHEPDKAVKQLSKAGVSIICSNHNFKETPDVTEMERQLSEMVEAGADFAKLAVMPKNRTDVLHLMEAVLSVKESYPNSHLIAMSMGADGMISRLLGEWYQSEVTFAAFAKSSAPGQISYGRIMEILEQIEECMER